MIELWFDITFTTPLAIYLINLSMLGFLCFLGYLPFHGSPAFFGFSGFFGLIGFAFLVEIAKRYTAKPQAETIAIPAMEKWLALMDNGEYDQSWGFAAPYLQRAVTKEEWIAKLKKVRFPLGPVISRKFSTSRLVAMGTRLEVKFASSFGGLLAATETVTFAKQPNGEWLAIGYLIHSAFEKSHLVLPWVAYGFACLAGVLGAACFFCWPHPSQILVWAIPVAAILGIILGIPTRYHRGGRQAIIVGALNLAIWLAIFAATFSWGRSGVVNNPQDAAYTSPLTNAPSVPDGPSSAGIQTDFGPVIERHMNGGSPTAPNWALNLESGHSVPLQSLELGRLFTAKDWPERYEAGNSESEKMQAWARENAVDIIINSDANGITLLDGFSLASYTASGEPQNGDDYWQMSPEQLARLVGDIEKSLGKRFVLPPPTDNTMKAGKDRLPKSFVFKTRQGGIGVLQIVRITERPPSVEVRYKLIRNAATAHAPVAAPQKFSFRPATELEFTNAAMMDLDSGKIFTEWPDSVTKPNSIVENVLSAFDWMQREGLDFAYLEGDGTYGVGIKLMALSPDDWDHLGAETLSVALAAINEPENKKLTTQPNSPSVFGFQTHEGNRGILEIDGATENPRSMKIRYKLVNKTPLN